MEFFNSAVGVLQTLVIALGAGLGVSTAAPPRSDCEAMNTLHRSRSYSGR